MSVGHVLDKCTALSSLSSPALTFPRFDCVECVRILCDQKYLVGTPYTHADAKSPMPPNILGSRLSIEEGKVFITLSLSWNQLIGSLLRRGKNN